MIFSKDFLGSQPEAKMLIGISSYSVSSFSECCLFWEKEQGLGSNPKPSPSQESLLRNFPEMAT